MWNFDLTTAPRDGSHVILAMKGGRTLRSNWLKPKHDPEHWCMLSSKEQPVAWMPWPQHPFATASQGEAEANAPTDVSLPVADRSGEGANTGGRHVTDADSTDLVTSGGRDERLPVPSEYVAIVDGVGGNI